jgi:hypothetical protein
VCKYQGLGFPRPTHLCWPTSINIVACWDDFSDNPALFDFLGQSFGGNSGCRSKSSTRRSTRYWGCLSLTHLIRFTDVPRALTSANHIKSVARTFRPRDARLAASRREDWIRWPVKDAESMVQLCDSATANSNSWAAWRKEVYKISKLLEEV